MLQRCTTLNCYISQHGAIQNWKNKRNFVSIFIPKYATLDISGVLFREFKNKSRNRLIKFYRFTVQIILLNKGSFKTPQHIFISVGSEIFHSVFGWISLFFLVLWWYWSERCNLYQQKNRFQTIENNIFNKQKTNISLNGRNGRQEKRCREI